MNSDLALNNLAEEMLNADRIVILTGAGMSAESGIGTFRGIKGYWSKYNPMELASMDGFRKNPEIVWKWYQERYKSVINNSPHAGHYAISELQKTLCEIVVITQNVDGYHQQAGTDNVLELHGSIVNFKCVDCEKVHNKKLVDGVINHCEYCNGHIRPDVVWFGEQLPFETLKEAENKSSDCDVIISIGTSSEVYPAAGLPIIAKNHGAKVVEINPNITKLSNEADIIIRESAKSFLPKLKERVFQIKEK
ncbi:MAG: SIR2 family NAD-dependent protein deacylase [Chlorobiota bacterium]